MSSTNGTPVHLYDEREVMEEFISCYQHFTALWDSTSSDYLSKQKKEPGYQQLLNILQRINGEASVQDVKRKINSLRCCYRREIKKVQASYNSYKPRLWWYHLMDFLNPVLNIQSSLRVKSESLDDSLEETSINDDDIFSGFPKEEDVLGSMQHISDAEVEPEPRSVLNDISSRSTRRVRRLESSSPSDYGEREVKRQRVSEEPSLDGDNGRNRDRVIDRESDSECELIGRRMASHFRNMRSDQRLFAERIIGEVLFFGRLNHLSLDSKFIPNPDA